MYSSTTTHGLRLDIGTYHSLKKYGKMYVTYCNWLKIIDSEFYKKINLFSLLASFDDHNILWIALDTDHGITSYFVVNVLLIVKISILYDL